MPKNTLLVRSPSSSAPLALPPVWQVAHDQESCHFSSPLGLQSQSHTYNHSSAACCLCSHIQCIRYLWTSLVPLVCKTSTSHVVSFEMERSAVRWRILNAIVFPLCTAIQPRAHYGACYDCNQTHFRPHIRQGTPHRSCRCCLAISYKSSKSTGFHSLNQPT